MPGNQEKATGIRDENLPWICKGLDRFISLLGEYAAWLNVILVLLIAVQVVMRYVFHISFVALEEAEWHLYGTAALFGISYCVVINNHIRVDILSQRFSPRTKEIVEILGILFLVMPVVTVLFVHGLEFVQSSWHVNESSRSPMGLPWRWAIKSVIPVSMALFGLSAISRAIRSAKIVIRGG